MLSLLDDYQGCTSVHVGNGEATFFWTNHWLGPAPLSAIFPTLYSYSTRGHISVSAALDGQEWMSHLGPRLTTAATAERNTLSLVLQDVSLIPDTMDVQFLRGTNRPFSAGGAYLHAMSTHPDAPASNFVWDNDLPPKCKFFFWLLHLDKLPTRHRLFRRHMIDNSVCPFCPSVETQEHLFLHCPHATRIWADLGIPEISSYSSIRDIWPALLVWGSTSSNPRIMAVTAMLWNIWKSRNSVVFQHDAIPTARTLQAIASDIMMWTHRLHTGCDKNHLRAWGHVVLNVI